MLCTKKTQQTNKENRKISKIYILLICRLIFNLGLGLVPFRNPWIVNITAEGRKKTTNNHKIICSQNRISNDVKIYYNISRDRHTLIWPICIVEEWVRQAGWWTDRQTNERTESERGDHATQTQKHQFSCAELSGKYNKKRSFVDNILCGTMWMGCHSVWHLDAFLFYFISHIFHFICLLLL